MQLPFLVAFGDPPLQGSLLDPERLARSGARRSAIRKPFVQSLPLEMMAVGGDHLSACLVRASHGATGRHWACGRVHHHLAVDGAAHCLSKSTQWIGYPKDASTVLLRPKAASQLEPLPLPRLKLRMV